MFKLKNLVILLLVTMVFAITACGNNVGSNNVGNDASVNEDMETAKEDTDMSSWKVPVDFPKGELLSGKHHVDIVIKEVGTVSVELDADIAPISVTNFMYLAQTGFYKNLTFHRIINNFMMQGGAPSATQEKPTPIKGEFASNGVQNSISHVRGVISMARSNNPDSATSQFFIVHKDSLYLDGQYAGFGSVTAGMEFVDQICENTPVQDSNGSVATKDQPVIEDIIVID